MSGKGQRRSLKPLWTVKAENIYFYKRTPKDLKAAFAVYGKIAKMEIPRFKHSTVPRGHVYIRYYDERDAVAASINMNGSVFDQRVLKVTLLPNKKARPVRKSAGGNIYTSSSDADSD